jgi:hypothetical protein
VDEQDHGPPLGRVARRLVELEVQRLQLAGCVHGLAVGDLVGDVDLVEDRLDEPACGGDLGLGPGRLDGSRYSGDRAQRQQHHQHRDDQSPWDYVQLHGDDTDRPASTID